MENLSSSYLILIAYLIGAIPFGFFFVKMKTGEDIRDVQSGRTGGTNAMRAAGFWVGFYTAILDILKGTGAVLLAKEIAPDNYWLHVSAGLAAIIGHNYSIFLFQRNPEGKIKLGGGAGGATCLGGSIGLWPTSVYIIFPLAALIYYFVGYASVTTMSVAAISAVIFAVRAVNGISPWDYFFFGLFSLMLLLWALRPNIKKLIAGTERLHGYRAKKKKQG